MLMNAPQALVKTEERAMVMLILILVIAFQVIPEATVKLVNDVLVYLFIGKKIEKIVKIVEY